MNKFTYRINKNKTDYHGSSNHLIQNPLNLTKEPGRISFNYEDENHLFICEDGTYELGGDGSIVLFLNPSFDNLEDEHSKADGYLDSIEGMKGEENVGEN